jgi:dihydropteroate synthase
MSLQMAIIELYCSLVLRIKTNSSKVLSTVRKDTIFLRNRCLKIGGELMQFSKPIIMGIVNLTPDSFYDGGKLKSESDVLNKAAKLLDEGADILDLGAYSSRPGAEHIEEEIEMKRLLPVLKTIRNEFSSCIISIDTFRSTIAKAAVETGADMINDISGGELDKDMMPMVARLKVPYVLMHMRGNPQTMQNDLQYDNVVTDLFHFFSIQLNKARELGISDVIIDPGFGFGKSLEDNYRLLKSLKTFTSLNSLVLAGISRKSMVSKVANVTSSDALSGSISLNTIALLNGADILRVHDVKAAKDAVNIVSYYQNV